MSGRPAVHLLLPPDRQPGRVENVLARARQVLAAGYVTVLWCDPSWPAAAPDDDRLRVVAGHDQATVRRASTVALGEDDLVFVAGPPGYRRAIRALAPGMSPHRVIHLVDDVREADPHWRGGAPFRLLARPAARISGGPAVAAAIGPWLDPRGLHRTIPEDASPRTLDAFLVEVAERVRTAELPDGRRAGRKTPRGPATQG